MINILRLISIIGIWLSAILIKEHVAAKEGLLGSGLCKLGSNFDCSLVALSKWSEFFGLPIASWGIVFYFLIFLFTFLPHYKRIISKERFASSLLLLSSFSLLYSAFLFSISYFSIGKLCLFCAGLYLVNICLFISAIILIRPDSFVGSLRDAFSGLLDFFKALLGRASGIQNSISRIFLLIFVAGIGAASVAEGFIREKIILPKAQVQMIVSKWESQPVTDLKLVLGAELISSDFFKGQVDAPIQIVEFSDLQCSACRKLDSILGPVLEKYKDQVSVVFKNFPIDNKCNKYIPVKRHENACLMAEFSRCAGEQGNFWQAIDYFFNLEEESVNISSVIKELNLDSQAMQQCLDSGRQMTRIQSDIEQAINLNIQGTPTVYVNGRIFNGRSATEYSHLFDFLINQQK